MIQYCTDDVVLNLQKEFSKYDIILSDDACEDDLADVFCDIIMTSMEKKSTPKALALHFAGQRERYSTLKNLLYFNESVPLVNFYIPNDLLLPDGTRKNAARKVMERLCDTINNLSPNRISSITGRKWILSINV